MADIVELGDIMALATTVDFVLQTIGFANDNERNSIRAAGLEQFEDFRYLTEKDIRDMAKSLESGQWLKGVLYSDLDVPRNSLALCIGFKIAIDRIIHPRVLLSTSKHSLRP